MNKYGKLINNSIQYPPNGVQVGNSWQIPPSEEWLMENGYKLVEEGVMPEPKEGFYFESSWRELEAKIIQEWTERQNEPMPEPSYSIEERTQVLEDTIAEIIEMLGGAK